MIDAYADQIRSPELLHVLIEGFDTHVLMSRTTCGDTGLTNTIVLPEPVWPKVIDRLSRTLNNSETSEIQRDWCWRYLARQCVPAFQRLYLERHPDVLDALSRPALRLELDSGADLIASLHRNGVLPEHARAIFVHRSSTTASMKLMAQSYGTAASATCSTPTRNAPLRSRLMTEVVADPRSTFENFTSWFPKMRILQSSHSR